MTPFDQPMYVRHDAYTGWIDNPSAIQPGWQLFQPVNGEWVTVQTVAYKGGNFSVYNVYTNSTNTYAVNGVLVDTKIA